MPAWVERYTLLDTGSKSYQGMIMQVHRFNNPVAHSALRILIEGGRRRHKSSLPLKVRVCGFVQPVLRVVTRAIFCCFSATACV